MLPMFIGASAVIVYRSSPNQKSEMVKYIRQNLKNKTLLAVGDGANDISMI